MTVGWTRRRVLLAGASGVVAVGGGAAAWREFGGSGTGRPVPGGVAAQEVQPLFDRRSAAVLRRDAAALRATAVPGAAAAQTALLGALAALPLESWSWKVRDASAFTPAAVGAVLSAAGSGSGPEEGQRIGVRLELDYRFAGYDDAPVSAARYAVLRRQGGAWLLEAEGARVGGSPQGDVLLWDFGPVAALKGRYALVLGPTGGTSGAALAGVGTAAQAAVPTADAVWGTRWGQHTVVQLPADGDQFAQLLGAAPGSVSGLAGATTGELGAGDSARTERITLNPAVWPTLSGLGRQVVLAHETTHVATRTQTEPWTPRWLSEGVADWTAYLPTGRTPRQICPELTAQVAAGWTPGALPADSAFTGDAADLPAVYQQSWFACRSIVQHHGAAALPAFYAAVARSGRGRASSETPAVVSALWSVLRTTLPAFTTRWRADLLAALRLPA